MRHYISRPTHTQNCMAIRIQFQDEHTDICSKVTSSKQFSKQSPSCEKNFSIWAGNVREVTVNFLPFRKLNFLVPENPDAVTTKLLGISEIPLPATCGKSMWHFLHDHIWQPGLIITSVYRTLNNNKLGRSVILKTLELIKVSSALFDIADDYIEV